MTTVQPSTRQMSFSTRHSSFSTTSTTATMHNDSAMHSSDGFKVFLNKMIRRRKEVKPMEISAPFNFQKCNLELAGISADEIAMLKEQAAASRIGIADFDSEYPTRAPFTIQPVMSSASISTIGSSYR
ncbi:hypothetical protein EsH8_VIII_000450 [Colletotrichum jinshuiense]